MKTLVAAAILLCAAAHPASAQTELKLGHVGSPGSLFALSADEFARRVKEKTKGKVLVPKGKWRIKMFQAYGASPSAMGLSEVFVALQTGVMDGEENPLTQIYTSKFQEVQKFLSMTDHVYTPAYLVVSPRKWAALPAEARKAVEEAARETQPFVYENGAKMDKDLLGKIKEAGLKVNEADKAAFQKASKPVYDEFAQEVPNGKEMIDKALALGPAK